MHLTARRQPEKQLLRQATAGKVALKPQQVAAKVLMTKYERVGSKLMRIELSNRECTFLFGRQSAFKLTFILRQSTFKQALLSNTYDSTLPKKVCKKVLIKSANTRNNEKWPLTIFFQNSGMNKFQFRVGWQGCSNLSTKCTLKLFFILLLVSWWCSKVEWWFDWRFN